VTQSSRAGFLTEYRGIPPGYLNALEQRLAETELALFLALSELKARNMPLRSADEKLFQGLNTLATKAKNDCIEEWKQHPLNDTSRWLAYKQPLLGAATSEHLGKPAIDERVNASAHLAQAPYFFQDNHLTIGGVASGFTEPPDDRALSQMGHSMPPHFRRISSSSTPREGQAASTTSSNSSAKSYAERHRHLYF
jgi:hypothetical protein